MGTRRLILAALCAAVAMSVAACSSGTAPRPAPSPETPRAGPREFQAYASVVVQPRGPARAIDRVLVSPQDSVIPPGGQLIFTAVALDRDGAPVAARFQWRLRTPPAGSVNGDGVFTASLTPGEYPEALQVTAANQGRTVTATANISVSAGGPTQGRTLSFIGVYPTQVVVNPGQVVGLGAIGWDERGRFVQNLKLSWRVLDPAAGTVDEFGFFTASRESGRYPNVVEVSATQVTPRGTVQKKGLVSVDIGETVRTGTLEKVVVVPGAVTLNPGQKARFIARAFDAAGQRMDGVTLTWQVDLPDAGRVEASGDFTAGATLKEFHNAVRVTASQRSGQTVKSLDAVATVVVEPVLVAKRLVRAQVVPAAVTISPGQRMVFSAFGLDEDGDPVAATPTWRVLQDKAGVLNGAGVFTAGSGPGIYSDAVMVELTQGGSPPVRLTATATVNVLGPLERIEVVPSSITVQAGDFSRLRAVAYDARGLPVVLVRFRWRVVDPRAGKIDDGGLFTAGPEPGTYPDAIIVTGVELSPP